MQIIKQSIITIIICLVVLAGVNLAFAVWTGPTCDPNIDPGACNVPAPVNVGGTPQQKTGTLRVGGLTSDFGTYLATLGGNVGIGTASPQAKLDVNGRIFRNGQNFSFASVANNNNIITVPWGTTADWNIFVSPHMMGTEEPGSEFDNALLRIECYATAISGTQWRITARYKMKYWSAGYGDGIGIWENGSANYLLVPK